MNDNTFWILFAVTIAGSLGLMLGVAFGDEVRRRKNAEAKVDDLRNHLQHTCSTPAKERQLKKMAIILCDAHKQITAVSKALQKRAS
jgi:hypothetical protein